MKKRITITSSAQLRQMKKDVLEQAGKVADQLRTLFADSSPFDALAKLRFQRTVEDEVFNEKMNFIEYLNQTFTYLVCLYAGQSLKETYPGKEIIINFGNQPGIDVFTSDESVACECFAATTVKSNGKLKAEVERLSKMQGYQYKYVFFYTQSAEQDRSFIEKLSGTFPGVKVCSIPFEALTTL